MRTCVLAYSLLLACCPLTLAADEEPQKLPNFAAVKTMIERHFAAQRDYKSGDLLTKSDVSGALDVIEKALGWAVTDREEIVEAALADDAPLAKRMRTGDGRKMMRQIARFPDGYDRLDRLQRLPDGERILRRLSQGPDGYKLIEYLAASDGGREMGKMLSEAPQGKDFNRRTGRIYTAEQLLKRLEKSHAAARAPRQR